MLTLPRLLTELTALTAAYWLIDRAVRLDGLLTIARALGLRSERVVATAVAVIAALAAPWVPWSGVPNGDVLRWLAFGLVAALAWKAATQDVDVVLGEAHWSERAILVLAVPLCVLSPAFAALACFLLTIPFRLWTHHSTLPMRLLQSVIAFLLSSAALRIPAVHSVLSSWLGAPLLGADAGSLAFFSVVMLVSHYVITALAKGWLGPQWYSWVADNRMHYLAASAYAWGWARFIPWPHWLKLIRFVQRVERPLQAFAFGLELLAPLALLDRWAAVGFCLGWAGFHCGVCALSGLWFWDWVLADLFAAGALAALPSSAVNGVFGPTPLLVGLLFMAAFPLRHKLWKPMPLGWYDTPFTQRIHWLVEGQSGSSYELYNDFMCPHERLYGKVHGCFLAPLPVVTYHLGEVYKRSLRDALVEAGPDLTRLAEVRERFGVDPRSAALAARHESYLRAFFAALERGARKHVLPVWLRWLKAPGDQLFCWGDLPRFVGQEPARRVRLVYRERYFDGSTIQLLTDQVVADYDLTSELGPQPGSAPNELTPKELDDHLLALAIGRLVDLPRFGGGYVRTDDGKRR